MNSESLKLKVEMKRSDDYLMNLEILKHGKLVVFIFSNELIKQPSEMSVS